MKESVGAGTHLLAGLSQLLLRPIPLAFGCVQRFSQLPQHLQYQCCKHVCSLLLFATTGGRIKHMQRRQGKMQQHCRSLSQWHDRHFSH